MSARATLLVPALAGLLLLAACDRNPQTPPAASGASTPASAPAAAASQPASAASSAMAPPLVPDQVVLASSWTEQEVVAGSQLAMQGAGAATACAGCHGPGGEGNAQAGFPRLAGLGRSYLLHQLNSYADGSRKHPVMTPIATAMNEQQRQAAAAFYASQGTPPGGTAPPAGGREPPLAGLGDDRRQVQACANCHGPQGVGDAATNPYLAGQHAGYLAATLGAWKSGERNNDPSGQMPRIAKTLTDDEVKALVGYYARLPPPAPRNGQAAAPPLAAGRTAVQSGPVAATAPSQGVGTEQGSPSTGGAQGQGAGGAATSPSAGQGAGGAAAAPASGASSAK
jgi:cytochrome c553